MPVSGHVTLFLPFCFFFLYFHVINTYCEYVKTDVVIFTFNVVVFSIDDIGKILIMCKETFAMRKVNLWIENLSQYFYQITSIFF